MTPEYRSEDVVTHTHTLDPPKICAFRKRLESKSSTSRDGSWLLLPKARWLQDTAPRNRRRPTLLKHSAKDGPHVCLRALAVSARHPRAGSARAGVFFFAHPILCVERPILLVSSSLAGTRGQGAESLDMLKALVRFIREQRTSLTVQFQNSDTHMCTERQEDRKTTTERRQREGREKDRNERAQK